MQRKLGSGDQKIVDVNSEYALFEGLRRPQALDTCEVAAEFNWEAGRVFKSFWRHASPVGCLKAIPSGYPCAMSPVNKCYACGAASYLQVIQRDAAGAMSPSGAYQCSGCRILFSSIGEWRHRPEQQQLANVGEQQLSERAPG